MALNEKPLQKQKIKQQLLYLLMSLNYYWIIYSADMHACAGLCQAVIHLVLVAPLQTKEFNVKTCFDISNLCLGNIC